MTTKRRIATVLAAASLMLSALAAPALGQGRPNFNQDDPAEGCEHKAGNPIDGYCESND